MGKKIERTKGGERRVQGNWVSSKSCGGDNSVKKSCIFMSRADRA